MAVRKNTGKKVQAKTSSPKGEKRKTSSAAPAKSKPWAMMFWAAFVIFLVGLFLLNREAIITSIQSVRNETPDKSAGNIPPELTETGIPPPPENAPAVTIVPPAETEGAEDSPLREPAAVSPERQSPPSGETPKPEQTQAEAPVLPPAPEAAAPKEDPIRPANTQAQSLPSGNPPAARPPQSTDTQAETRERLLYFIRIDRDGFILRESVSRRLPVSPSPLTDALNTLMAGPNDDEKGKGLISLIPAGTRILSAVVRGETAYISFSEDFLYNTYGVEGYAGQLRQIIYTVTEFSNVEDVQILIEGRRLDYLGEGIWIGSPVDRESF